MPKMLSTLALRQAVTAIQGGGVVACPTEAVWGLSCDPFNEMAVARLLYLKQRKMAKVEPVVWLNTCQGLAGIVEI